MALLMGQILLLMPTGGRGGWSSDGCSIKDKKLNETVCTCSHLTSFGILMVTYPCSMALDSGSEGYLGIISEYLLFLMTRKITRKHNIVE